MMSQKRVIYIDPTHCRGCGRCELVCSFSHEGVFSVSSSRIRLSNMPDNVSTVPVICQHCETPYCMFACPTNAIAKDSETGIVNIDHEACIGCLMCFLSCPFGGISISPARTPIKCDLCGGDPECVKVCDYNAIEYLTTEQANSQKRKEGLVKVLKEALK